MKKTKSISLRFKTSTFNLLLTGKVTVVAGNSGTGKTFLAREASNSYDNHQVVNLEYRVLGVYAEFFNHKSDILALCDSDESSIIIIDEEVITPRTNEVLYTLASIINNCKNPNVRFVLIGRILSKYLACGAKDIMKIVQTGPNDYTFEREDMIPLQTDDNKNDALVKLKLNGDD